MSARHRRTVTTRFFDIAQATREQVGAALTMTDWRDGLNDPRT